MKNEQPRYYIPSTVGFIIIFIAYIIDKSNDTTNMPLIALIAAFVVTVITLLQYITHKKRQKQQ